MLSADLARKQRFNREATAIGASAIWESSDEDRRRQPVEEPCGWVYGSLIVF